MKNTPYVDGLAPVGPQHITTTFTAEGFQNLESLRERMRCPDHAELFRRELALLDIAEAHCAKGGIIVFRDPPRALEAHMDHAALTRTP